MSDSVNVTMGDDISLTITVKTGSVVDDISGATSVTVALVDKDGAIALSGTDSDGTNWATGVIVVSFNAADTGGLDDKAHYTLQVVVDKSGIMTWLDEDFSPKYVNSRARAA